MYTFTQDGEYLVFRVRDRDVIPFWSSRSRVQRVQALHPKYQCYDVREMPLEEFLAWLPELEAQAINIGTNWSGQRLVGYDVSVPDLVAGIDFWLARKRATGRL